MGRRSAYTTELAAKICERLAAGESLRSICRDDDMPADSTVRLWVADDVEGFSAQYARARDTGLDTMADSMLDIADDGSNDWVESNDPDNPGYRLNGENVQRSKLRVDARKWYLSKLAPKKYGDKTSMELTGADGGPLQITDTERAARLAAILALARQRAQASEGEDLDGLV
ncbi:hypothetical protein ABS755_07270 [Castellaniella sp. FW104-16D08]|uniref:terminase small subunit-like protein n=1 Tax=unclassified Castellaniella TaxID=2617606 RepID=UPI00331489FD